VLGEGTSEFTIHFFLSYLPIQLEKLSFEIPVCVSHFERHEELKGELLALLNSLAAQEIKGKGSPIAKSSYGQGKLNQQWRPLFLKAIMPHLNELFSNLSTPSWEIRQMWFQFYRSVFPLASTC
jgi:hypothetical protein